MHSIASIYKTDGFKTNVAITCIVTYRSTLMYTIKACSCRSKATPQYFKVINKCRISCEYYLIYHDQVYL